MSSGCCCDDRDTNSPHRRICTSVCTEHANRADTPLTHIDESLLCPHLICILRKSRILTRTGLSWRLTESWLLRRGLSRLFFLLFLGQLRITEDPVPNFVRRNDRFALILVDSRDFDRQVGFLSVIQTFQLRPASFVLCGLSEELKFDQTVGQNVDKIRFCELQAPITDLIEPIVSVLSRCELTTFRTHQNSLRNSSSAANLSDNRGYRVLKVRNFASQRVDRCATSSQNSRNFVDIAIDLFIESLFRFSGEIDLFLNVNLNPLIRPQPERLCASTSDLIQVIQSVPDALQSRRTV